MYVGRPADPPDGLAAGGGSVAAVCVVDGVEESVLALQPAADSRRRFAVAARRIDHRGQRGGVWRDDQFVAQAALQPEARDAERLVLIVPMTIDDVVGRL